MDGPALYYQERAASRNSDRMPSGVLPGRMRSNIVDCATTASGGSIEHSIGHLAHRTSPRIRASAPARPVD